MKYSIEVFWVWFDQAKHFAANVSSNSSDQQNTAPTAAICRKFAGQRLFLQLWTQNQLCRAF